MKQTIEIQAVDLVRRIRDDQAERLAHKSVAEVMEFFNRAAGRARKQSGKPEAVQIYPGVQQGAAADGAKSAPPQNASR